MRVHIADWEGYAALLVERDVYGRLRSIHNCWTHYDFSRPWVTHCSIQRQPKELELDYITDWRRLYKKPVVIDEMGYEGNLEYDWGNLTAEDLVHRFWVTALLGGYGTHGECFDSEGPLWWSHGGMFAGKSTPRLRFLLERMAETPGRRGLRLGGEKMCGVPDVDGVDEKSYRLYYFGIGAPVQKVLHLEDDASYSIERIDAWNMTVEHLGEFSGIAPISLPGRKYMALRVIRRTPAEA